MISNNSKAPEDEWKKSGISLKYPSYRNSPFMTSLNWLKGKQLDDEAEGLWRIHDDIYDLTTFVDKHPGGPFWLEQTKGTDITEVFETHHITGVPQTLLEQFKVGKASRPRNYTLTMNTDGFYQTLKRRVAAQLKDIDRSPEKKTFFYHLLLFTSTLLLCIISSFNISFIFELLAGLSLAWLSILSHNYLHKPDNWQMYTFNLSLMNFAEWRILHVFSHHNYTNSMHDLEISLFEPFLTWFPNKNVASKGMRIIMLLWQPLVYMGIFPIQLLKRVASSMIVKNELFWHDLIGFSLPLIMVCFSTSPTLVVILQWLRILAIASLIFGLTCLSSSHHTPDIYHDGDAMRKDRDWGLYQLDSVIDRIDIKSSQFMVLTHFGEHAMHHLFPTLDHGLLPQLYPALHKTLEEFKGEFREITLLDHVIGQNKQILRTEPNPIPPCERKSKKS